jgi:predicted nucleic acid-binding protein
VSHELVVDASVVIKLFVDEELSDRAIALFGLLRGDDPPRFYVPDLFFIECANILWKYVRRLGLQQKDALHAISNLIKLPLHPVATTALLPGSLALAIENGITAYDAGYVSLADRLNTTLVTADGKLIRKLGNCGVDVRWLGDLSL